MENLTITDDFGSLIGPDTSESTHTDSTAFSDNRAVAIDLGSRGFAVFPIRIWGDGDDWKPVKGFPERATDDVAQISAWWAKWPEARVGLLTDVRNDISVLDLDTKKGKDGIAALAALGFADLAALSPVRVRTPSGGWHLYFRHDQRLKNSTSEIGEGIDVKTRRGFVVAPGSLKDGLRYEPIGAPLGSVELPCFPEALIPEAEPEREPVEIVSEPTGEQLIWAENRLRKWAGRLTEMGEGGRNSALNSAAMWAGGAAAHGFLTRELVEEILSAAAAEAGLRKSEIRATFKSGFTKGLSKPISDFPTAVDTDASEFDDLDEIKPKETDEKPRLRFLTPSECAGAPSRGYVIKGLLAPGDVGCIYGAPGAGKSLISPHLGFAVAQGRSAFDMRTKPGSVFYVAAEDPHGMRGRVSALKLRHGDAERFMVVEGVSDLLAKESPDLKALYQVVKKQKPALMFIDTLAMAFPGLEENSAEDMGRVVAIARKLASHGTAVVLIHHDTKAGTPTPRGHSLLNGALDVAVQLFARDESGIVRGKLTKNRNGSCDRDIAFRIATEAMGDDEDGDPITFALVDELAPGIAVARHKLTPSERAALEVLKDLIEASGDCDVSETDWRVKCIDGRTVSAAEDPDSRKRAARRAFEGLARKRAVLLRDGMATLPHWAATESADGQPFDDLDEDPLP